MENDARPIQNFILDGIKEIDDNEELRIVWKAMKKQWDKNAQREVETFSKGESVQVEFKSGKLYNAEVIKSNKKTVTVQLLEEGFLLDKDLYNVHPKWLHRN